MMRVVPCGMLLRGVLNFRRIGTRRCKIAKEGVNGKQRRHWNEPSIKKKRKSRRVLC